MRNKGLKVILRMKKKARTEFEDYCLRGATKPMTLEQARSLAPISMEVFRDNPAKLFGLVLQMVSEGHSLPQIERQTGMTRKLLNNMMTQYPRLHAKVKEARKLKLDEKLMSEIDIFA